MPSDKRRITGQLGKIFDDKNKKVDYTFKQFDNGSRVMNIRLKPKDEEWITCAIWDDNADRLKSAIDNDGFTKFSFEGVDKKKKSGEKEYSYFNVYDMAMMKAIQVDGKIVSYRDNSIKVGKDTKEIQELLIVDKTHEKTYKINVWPETNIASKLAMKKGDALSVNGEGTFLKGNKEEYVSIQAYDIAKDKNQLKSIMEEKANPKKSLNSDLEIGS